MRDGQVLQRVRIWIGWFDRLMERVSPAPSGWTGLALPYHLHTGWYEASPWPVPSNALAEVRDQWAAIATNGLDTEALAMHGAVLGLLDEAQRTRADVQLSYS